MCGGVLLLGLFVVVASCDQYYEDTFSYPDGSDGSPSWMPLDYGFEVKSGVLTYVGPERAFSKFETAGNTDHGSFACDVIIRGRSGKTSSWMVAGIAFMRDTENFWALQLVESPASDGYDHFVEFAEMRDSNWNNQGDDGDVISWNGSLDWEYDVPYRLNITIQPPSILHSYVFSSLGEQLVHISYNLTNPQAVNSGAPTLSTGTASVEWDNATASISHSVNITKQFPPFPNIACTSLPKQESTGFFHVKKVDGKWWLIDPHGNLFFMVAMEHVNYWVHACEALGTIPYHDNCFIKYNDSSEAWGKVQMDRLSAWGFNTLASGHSDWLEHNSFAHTISHDPGTSFAQYVSNLAPPITWTGFPNVFDPNWEPYLRVTFSDSDSYKDDPWVIGHYVDNELQWWGHPVWSCWATWCMFNTVWTKPSNHTGKQAWVQFLKEEIPIDFSNKFYEGWGVSVSSADDLLSNTSPTDPLTDWAESVTRDFIRLVAEKYFQGIKQALSLHDPNHLYLCTRFPGSAPDILDIAAQYCDVITFNYYPSIEPDFGVPDSVIEVMRSWYQLSGDKPYMITEWGYPGLDAGLPSSNGAGMRVDYQSQRAQCYTLLQTMMMSQPFLVGDSFFMHVDEPALGISSTFPENSNYGFVNVTDDVWPPIAKAASILNPTVCSLHSECAQHPVIWSYQPYLDLAYLEPSQNFTLPYCAESGKMRACFPSSASSSYFCTISYTPAGSTEQVLTELQARVVFTPSSSDHSWWMTPSTTTVTRISSSSSAISVSALAHYPGVFNATFEFVIPTHVSCGTPFILTRMLDFTSLTGDVDFEYILVVYDSTDTLVHSATPPAPYSNYWQRGSGLYFYSSNFGFGTWWMGDSMELWEPEGPAIILNRHFEPNVTITEATNYKWTVERNDRNTTLFFLFPFEFASSSSTEDEIWTAMNNARVCLQSAVISSPSPSGSADDSSGTNIGSDSVSTAASFSHICLYTLVAPLLVLLCLWERR